MITTGIKPANKATDILLDLLSNPKKASDTLKKLSAENAKLAKQTKDLLKAKSLNAYCNEQQELAVEAKQAAVVAKTTIKKERAKYEAYEKDVLAKAEELDKAHKQKEEELAVLVLTLKEKQEAIASKEEALAKREEKLEGAERRALATRKEYEAKIADLKERMKGL